MITGIKEMQKCYCFFGICLFSDAVTLPGLCNRILLQSLPPTVYFSCISEENQSVFHALRKGVTGELACVFTRWYEAGKSHIRDNQEICQKVEGWDCNSLYLRALGQPLPIGNLTIRQAAKGFCPEGKAVKKAVIWLDFLSQVVYKQFIQHEQNVRER